MTLSWTYQRSSRSHTGRSLQDGTLKFYIRSNAPAGSAQGVWGYCLLDHKGKIIRHGATQVGTLKREAAALAKKDL